MMLLLHFSSVNRDARKKNTKLCKGLAWVGQEHYKKTWAAPNKKSNTFTL